MTDQPEPSSDTAVVVVLLVVILTVAIFGYAAYRWSQGNPVLMIDGPSQTYKPHR
jgi:hypothetical protein